MSSRNTPVAIKTPSPAIKVFEYLAGKFKMLSLFQKFNADINFH
jgi:hypothetical protein